MSEPLQIAIAGVGRMGAVHALHLAELARETGLCALAAIVDSDADRARRVADDINCNVPIFETIEQLAAANICNATLISTPTRDHQSHAMTLIGAGHRVLLEKPLTGALTSDRELSQWLDNEHPNSLMLAFQRRFDPPLQYAKELLDSGAIGPVFKLYSALEDSAPAPDGYNSPGILADMSIHNVDEVLWLTGKSPQRALAIGSRLYSHRLTTCREDFDDAGLYVWFPGVMAQIQVTRNHVSGYRVETIIFGEEGQIQIGRFDQRPFDITVTMYGRRGRVEPLAYRVFTMRRYEQPVPEFVDRFGPAYKAEVETFVKACRTDEQFPISHREGIRAQAVIAAGMQSMIQAEDSASLIAHT